MTTPLSSIVLDSGLVGIAEASLLPAIPIDIGTLDAARTLFSGRCLLRGWYLINGGSGRSDFQLRDGTADTHPLIAWGSMANDDISEYAASGPGIVLRRGIYMKADAYPFYGVIYVTPIGGTLSQFQP